MCDQGYLGRGGRKWDLASNRQVLSYHKPLALSLSDVKQNCFRKNKTDCNGPSCSSCHCISRQHMYQSKIIFFKAELSPGYFYALENSSVKCMKWQMGWVLPRSLRMLCPTYIVTNGTRANGIKLTLIAANHIFAIY